MFKEKSFRLLVLGLVLQVCGFVWLRRNFALVKRHTPVQLTSEEKMLVFTDVANDLGLQ